MRKTKDCNFCNTPPAFPLNGASFSRRGFLRLGATGLVASYFSDVFTPSLLHASTTSNAANVKGTAKNCIMIFLEGAPSHVDMWDLKEGSWTPPALQPTSYGAIRWPQGLLPKSAAHLDKMAIVRSSLSWVAVHQLGVLWAQIGRNPAGVLGNVAPHIGAVVALESYKTRKVSDILPAFIALEQPPVTSGYFSAIYGPLVLRARGGMSTLSHGDGDARLEQRLSLIGQLDKDRGGALGKDAKDFGDFYASARNLTTSPEIGALFDVPAADRPRYGSTGFGDALILAKQLIASHRGTRFVQATSFGWDHHSDLYAGLAQRCREFDSAFAALVDDLKATPGEEAGQTLLDETLIVIYSEFGRTTGPLNGQAGRDHFPRMSVVFAGGGVRGNNIIGATDNVGNKAAEYGWRGNRDVRPEDITCTLYSALGIDYTSIRRDDPLNRGFEYVPFAADGLYEPVMEVFA
ncbi:MAG TPA: DUF1501 domain-containing protein [Thermoanaerobaculia bacterium]|jgi:hypothetical protein